MDAALGLLGAILVLHALESPRPLPAVAEPVLQRDLAKQTKHNKNEEKNENKTERTNEIVAITNNEHKIMARMGKITK